MAYVYDDRVWSIDAVDIVTHRPVWLRQAVLYPNAIGDYVVFKSFNPQGDIGSGENPVWEPYANPPVANKKGYTLRDAVSTLFLQTVSVTGTNAFEDPATGGTMFTASNVGTPPTIMRLLASSGSTNNYRLTVGPNGEGLGGYLYVATRNNDNKVTCATATGVLTDEASKIMSWRMIQEDSSLKSEFRIDALQTSGADTIVQGAVAFDFGPNGRWFPNLICRELSASATIDLYLK